MSACSSLWSGARRRSEPAAPVLPLVACPDCGRQVKVAVSGTDECAGWVFYRCRFHGSTCDFWHWEREYVYYLGEEKMFLSTEDEIEAVGWAEERREDLERALGRKKFAEQWGAGQGVSTGNNNARNEALLKRSVAEMVAQGREMVMLLKIALGMLCFVAFVCVAVVLRK